MPGFGSPFGPYDRFRRKYIVRIPELLTHLTSELLVVVIVLIGIGIVFTAIRERDLVAEMVLDLDSITLTPSEARQPFDAIGAREIEISDIAVLRGVGGRFRIDDASHVRILAPDDGRNTLTLQRVTIPAGMQLTVTPGAGSLGLSLRCPSDTCSDARLTVEIAFRGFVTVDTGEGNQRSIDDLEAQGWLVAELEVGSATAIMLSEITSPITSQRMPVSAVRFELQSIDTFPPYSTIQGGQVLFSELTYGGPTRVDLYPGQIVGVALSDGRGVVRRLRIDDETITANIVARLAVLNSLTEIDDETQAQSLLPSKFAAWTSDGTTGPILVMLGFLLTTILGLGLTVSIIDLSRSRLEAETGEPNDEPADARKTESPDNLSSDAQVTPETSSGKPAETTTPAAPDPLEVAPPPTEPPPPRGKARRSRRKKRPKNDRC